MTDTPGCADMPAAHTEFVECVAFILIQGEQFLAEKRKLTKPTDPGIVALPGGHVERGESPEETLCREANEELGIFILSGAWRYICTLLHRSQEWQRVHYFAIEAWEGEIGNHEAEALLWIPIARPEQLDLEVDRVAIGEYVRLYSD